MEHIPEYDTLEEARAAVEDHLSNDVVDDAFEAVGNAADEFVSEYELEDEVDVDEVRRWLRIGWCENAVGFVADGVWESESDVRDVIDSIRHNPVSNAMTIAGTVAQRNQDMMRVSGAILQRKYSRGEEG